MIIVLSLKNLSEEFEKLFNYLGKNTEKYITFPVLKQKEVMRVNKSRREITKTLSYRLQFIDSAGFIASSLSNSE